MQKIDNNYALARQLRRDMSLPERLLWQRLRARKAGFKFRRQHPVGSYVTDLYCAAAKLAIEIDGVAHDFGDRPSRDETRDAFLARQGIEVVRIPASEVLRNADEAAALIVDCCKARC